MPYLGLERVTDNKKPDHHFLRTFTFLCERLRIISSARKLLLEQIVGVRELRSGVSLDAKNPLTTLVS